MDYLSICAFAVLLAVVLSFTSHFQKFIQIYRLAPKIPGPKGLPILGSLLEFTGPKEEYVNVISKIATTYSSPCGVWLGPIFAVILSKWEDIDIVLKHPGCYNKSTLYLPFEFFAKDGIFIMNDNAAKYKTIKKLIMKQLNSKTIDGYIGVFKKHTEKFCASITGENIIDIRNEVVYLALRSTSETLWGCKMSDEETKYIGNLIEEGINFAFEKTTNMFLWNDKIYSLTNAGKKFNEICDIAFKILRDKTADLSRRLPNEDFEVPNPLGKVLFELFDSGSSLNERELHQHYLSLLVAESDTTSSSICYLLMILGIYQEVQQKVYEEIISFEYTEDQITVKDVNKLTYLERVIKEMLRLTPMGIVFARQATEAIKLDSCILPKGTEICIDVRTLHRDPRYWKEPLKFDPDRFLPEEYSKLPNSAYIPWSAGLRICPGASVSLVILKVIVIIILKRFIIHCPYKSVSEIEVNGTFISKPKFGALVSFRNR